MLALAVSLLFGLAALAALAVIRSSLLAGTARVRLILAELAAIERLERTTRPAPTGSPPRLALRPAFAAA